MTTILKNTTGLDIYVVGRQLVASGQDDFSKELAAIMQTDPILLPAVDSGDIVVNDGTNDLSAVIGRKFIEKTLLRIDVEENSVITSTDVTTFNFLGQVSTTDIGSGVVDVNVAPGLSALVGLLGDQIIGGDAITSENMMFVTDTTRGDKILSTEAFNFTYANNSVNNNDWMPASHVSDAVSGLILPYDAVLIRATGHCVDTGSNSKDFSLWVDNVDTAIPLGNLTGGVDVKFITSGLNIDAAAGSKIRVRGASTGGRINDTLLTLWFKWRLIP